MQFERSPVVFVHVVQVPRHGTVYVGESVRVLGSVDWGQGTVCAPAAGG